MCQPRARSNQAGLSGCTCTPCGCGCGCGPSFRRFFSPQEKQECLETYADQLKKELAGVTERIDELTGK